MYTLNIKSDIFKFWNSLLDGKCYILIEKNQNSLQLKETPVYNHLEEKIPIEEIAKIVRQNYLQLETYLKEAINLKNYTYDSLLRILKDLFVTPLLKETLSLDKADIVNYIVLYLFLIGTNLIKTNHLHLSEKEVARLIELTYQNSLYLSEEKIALIINLLNFLNYDLNLSNFKTSETKIIHFLKNSFFRQIPSSRNRERRLALVHTLFLKSNQNLTTLFLTKLKTTIIASNQHHFNKAINNYSEIEKIINNPNPNLKKVSLFNKSSILNPVKEIYYPSLHNDLQEILNTIFKTANPKRLVNLKEYIDNHLTINLTTDLCFAIQLNISPIAKKITMEIENVVKTFNKKDLKEIEIIIFTKQLDKIVNTLKLKAVELNILDSAESFFYTILTRDELIRFDRILKSLVFRYSTYNLRTSILDRKDDINNFALALKEIFHLYYEKRQMQNEIENLPDLNKSIIDKSISYLKKGIKDYLLIQLDNLEEADSNTNILDPNIPEEVLSKEFNNFFFDFTDKNALLRMLNPRSKITNEDIVNYIVLYKKGEYLDEKFKLFFLYQVVQKLQKRIKTLPPKYSSILRSRLDAIKNAVQTHLNPWIYFCVFGEIDELSSTDFSILPLDLKSIIDVGFMLQAANIISSRIVDIVEFDYNHSFWYKKLYNSLQSNTYKDKITSIFITNNRNLYAKILFDNIVKNLIE